jgi:hypothetical protein
MPPSFETPIVMIAGGVGIAPFRAFLYERLAHLPAKVGPALLLYGVRSASDSLYSDLLHDALSKGALTSLDVGVGSPNNLEQATNLPRFIDSMLLDHSDTVWTALQVRKRNIIAGSSSECPCPTEGFHESTQRLQQCTTLQHVVSGCAARCSKMLLVTLTLPIRPAELLTRLAPAHFGICHMCVLSCNNRMAESFTFVADQPALAKRWPRLA